MTAFRDSIYFMRRNLYPLILFGIISVALFSPFLFGSTIFSGGDSVTQFYPYAFLYDHSDSQWNPYIYAGMSVASTFQFAYFDPIYKLFFQLPRFLDGFHLILLVNLFLSLAFTYFFAVNLKFNKAEATLIAVIYALNAHNLSSISAITFTNVVWILPALFLSVDKIISGRNGYSPLIAFAVGFGFLSSHYQFLAMSILSAMIYFCFKSYLKIKNGEEKRALLIPLVSLVAGLATALLIGLPQLLNIYEFTKLSTRSGGYGFINATATGMTPIDLFGYVFPALSLPQGLANGFLNYIGIIGIILAIIGIKNIWSGDALRKFFVGGFVFLLLASFKYSPLYLLIYFMPPMMFFQGSSRVIFIAGFFVAIIAGYGARDIIYNFEKNKKLFFWLLISGGLLVAVAAFIANLGVHFKQPIANYINHYFDIALYQHTTKQPLEYYHDLIGKMYDSMLYTFNFNNPMTLITIVLCFTLYFIVKKELVKKERLAGVFLIGSLINLLPLFYTLNTFTDRKLIDQEPRSAKIIKAMTSTGDNYRAISFLFPYAGYTKITALHPNDLIDQYEFFKEGMVPNLNIFYGINILNGYEPMKIAKREKLFKEIFIDEEKISVDQKLQAIEQRVPLLSLLNVKFLVMPFPLIDKNLNLISEYKVTKYDLSVYIYENKQFIPKIYVAKKPVCFTDENKLFAGIINRTDNDAEDAYVLQDDCKIFNQNLEPATIDKFLVERSDGIARIEVRSDHSFWLIFSESNLPGWRVTIDTRSAKVYNANYLFQAVDVPAGDHVVEFNYKGAVNFFNSE
jgi:hypothetical protein